MASIVDLGKVVGPTGPQGPSGQPKISSIKYPLELDSSGNLTLDITYCSNLQELGTYLGAQIEINDTDYDFSGSTVSDTCIICIGNCIIFNGLPIFVKVAGNGGYLSGAYVFNIPINDIHKTGMFFISMYGGSNVTPDRLLGIYDPSIGFKFSSIEKVPSDMYFLYGILHIPRQS